MFQGKRINTSLKRIILGTIALGCVVVSLYFFFKWKESPEVRDTLKEANERTVRGEYGEAFALLESILNHDPNPRSIQEYLRLHLAIASARTDYAGLLEATKKAVTLFGDRAEYWRYRILAESRSGFHETALTHSETHLNRRIHGDVITEITLAAGKVPDTKIIPDRYSELVQLIESDNPESFYTAGKTFNSSEFSAEAVVRCAEQKGTTAALEYLVTETKKDFPEMSLFVLYDARDFESAGDILSTIEINTADPDFLALKGDIYLLNGLFRSSQSIYERLVLIHPDLSAIPYHNISRFRTKEEDSIAIIEEGLTRFPNNSTLQQSYITLLMKRGEFSKARERIEDYLVKHPEDTYVGFLRDYIYGETTIPDLHTARLWARMNEGQQKNETTASYAAWYFGSGKQYDELNRILDRTEDEHLHSSWYKTFKGIQYALENRYQESEKLFTTAWKLDRTPENLYNASLVRYASGDRDEGITLLTRAFMEATQGKTDTRTASIIAAELGTKLLSEGEKDQALSMAREALDLDPANLQAKHLEKMIRERNF